MASGQIRGEPVSIAHFALSAASIAETVPPEEKVTKAPPKRQIAALRDATVAPELR